MLCFSTSLFSPFFLTLGYLFAGTAAALHAEEDPAEKGFTSLCGDDAQGRWVAYAMDDSKGEWPKSWKLEAGVLHCLGGAVGDLKSKEKYADFDLRFQWKISPAGNSGVMYRVSQEKDPSYHTGPEYQVVDNAAEKLEPTANTAAGSLYEMYSPTEAAAKEPGQWNDARIVLDGNRIEHYLNGKLIVEAEMESDDWKARLAKSKFIAWKGFAKNRTGHVVLQDHGNEVWYRDVRIKPLAAKAVD